MINNNHNNPNLVAESDDDVTLWQVWNAWRSCCSQRRQVVQPVNLEQRHAFCHQSRPGHRGPKRPRGSPPTASCCSRFGNYRWVRSF